MKRSMRAGTGMVVRFLLILAGAGMIAGGAYLLHERTEYDREIARQQAEVLAALEKVIPGYAEAGNGAEQAAKDDAGAASVSAEQAAKEDAGAASGSAEQAAKDSAGAASGSAEQARTIIGTGEAGSASAAGLGARPLSVVSIDGIDCVGILEIPSVKMVVAVASSKEAPEYMAYIAKVDARSGDVSIAGENRDSLLGRLPEVSEGDQVLFTDIYGDTKTYLVNAVYTSEHLPEDTAPGGSAQQGVESADASPGGKVPQDASEEPGTAQSAENAVQTDSAPSSPLLNLCCPQGKNWFIAECTQ